MGNNLLFPGEIPDITEKEIQEMKELFEKQHDREFSWDDSKKAVQNIRVLAEIISAVVVKEWVREEKLKEFPKGFHLDESSYYCEICGGTAKGEDSWFDKYGIKCMICQNAINEKIIPAALAKNKEIWYSTFEMGSYFNIWNPLLNKFIKQGLFRVRTIFNEQKKIHLHVFLLKENKDILPPKKLLAPRIVSVERKGKEYKTCQDWYEYADIKLAKKIMKYGIFDCLKESFSKPFKSGRLYANSVSPLFSYKK